MEERLLVSLVQEGDVSPDPVTAGTGITITRF